MATKTPAKAKPEPQAAKPKEGRPPTYKAEFVELVFNYCLLGSTDVDLAVFFDVDVSTINRWKIEHPEFQESLKRGKEQADAEIAKSLYQTALSGNTTAQIFWLKNRKSSLWRDKQEVDHTTGGVSFNIDLGGRRAQERAKP